MNQPSISKSSQSRLPAWFKENPARLAGIEAPYTKYAPNEEAKRPAMISTRAHTQRLRFHIVRAARVYRSMRSRERCLKASSALYALIETDRKQIRSYGLEEGLLMHLIQLDWRSGCGNRISIFPFYAKQTHTARGEVILLCSPPFSRSSDCVYRAVHKVHQTMRQRDRRAAPLA